MFRLVHRYLSRFIRRFALAICPFIFLFFTYGFLEGSIHLDVLVRTNVALAQRPYTTEEISKVMGALSKLATVAAAPYVPMLLNPTGWWEDLGLVCACDADDGTNFDPRKSLSDLYRPKSDAPWHHWVIVSSSDGYLEDKAWSEGFDQLIQYHYANPAANNASFHHVLCKDNIMCDMLMARSPSLLHFTTETPSGMRPSARGKLPNHEPVTVRLIQLPLPRDLPHMAPGLFPSPFNQLRSLTENPSDWQRWDQYSLARSFTRRLAENKLAKTEMKRYLYSYGILRQITHSLLNQFAILRPIYGVSAPAGMVAHKFTLGLFSVLVPELLKFYELLKKGHVQISEDGSTQPQISTVVIDTLDCHDDISTLKPDVAEAMQEMFDAAGLEHYQNYHKEPSKRQCAMGSNTKEI